MPLKKHLSVEIFLIVHKELSKQVARQLLTEDLRDDENDFLAPSAEDMQKAIALEEEGNEKASTFNDPVYYCNRAAAHCSVKQYHLTIQDCRAALALDENYAKAYGLMGLAYSCQNRYGSAIEAYKKALELDPNNYNYKNNIANAEQKIRQACRRFLYNYFSNAYDGYDSLLKGSLRKSFDDLLTSGEVMEQQMRQSNLWIIEQLCQLFINGNINYNLFFPNTQQFHQSTLPQEFSLPMPTMKYIWSNPSTPKSYQKLIKCCKLFFIKNPIFIMNNLDHSFSGGWENCNAKKCPQNYSCKAVHERFDMNKIKAKKIWTSKKLCVIGFGQPNLVSSMVPKIYRYTVKFLKFEGQHLSYNELKFLACGVKKCELNDNIVKYDNDEKVELENIILLFSGAKKVSLGFEKNPDNAACKNYDDFINACNTVTEAVIYKVPAIFDVPTFYQHLKCSKNCSLVDIYSSSNNHDRLNEVIVEILATKSFNFVPPVIKYSGDYPYNTMKMYEIQAKIAGK